MWFGPYRALPIGPYLGPYRALYRVLFRALFGCPIFHCGLPYRSRQDYPEVEGYRGKYCDHADGEEPCGIWMAADRHPAEKRSRAQKKNTALKGPEEP